MSERDDKLLAEHMAKLHIQNGEVDGDVSSEEEDTGMGEIDLDNSAVGIARVTDGKLPITHCHADWSSCLEPVHEWCCVTLVFPDLAVHSAVFTSHVMILLWSIFRPLRILAVLELQSLILQIKLANMMKTERLYFCNFLYLF